MRHKPFPLALLVTFTLLLSSSPLTAASVRLKQTRGLGVSDTLVETYAELVKMYLKEAKQSLVSSESESAELEFNAKITKVGEGFILTLEKQGPNSPRFEESFKVASENELDLGTKRLVAAVLAGKPVQSSLNASNVTEAEASLGTQRQATVNRLSLAFGPSGSYGMGTQKTFYDFKLAYTFERDNLAPRVFGEVNWGPGIRDAFAFAGGLGLDYYLSSGKEAPHVGVDLGLGGYHRASTWETARDGKPMYRSGFALGLTAGYTILRNAETSMYVQANYRPIFGGFGGQAAALYGLQVGLLY